ncbi:MAG: aminoacyl-tRNA hydrolase [Myxococcales bacterium]|nr:aminoacyl-tRNA hydrolase [Myxococcales bacterium]
MREIRISHCIVIPEREVRESFVTSTGPGGQNVNKVATKVELRWVPKYSSAFRDVELTYLLHSLEHRLTNRGELLVTCDEHRTQIRNREEIRSKLAAIVRKALVRPKNRRATRPTKASVRRRLDGKRKRSDVKKGRSKARHED